MEKASRDKGLQRELIAICKEDILYWVNAMVWTYQPRDRSRPVIRPMIAWPKQDDFLLGLKDSINEPEHSVFCAEKSREQGGTWLTLVEFDWWCRFGSQPESFLIASRNQDLVDKAGDTDTLYAKLDFLQDYLPMWLKALRLDETRKQNHVEYATKSVIDGCPTTVDIGRGGRRTAGLLDENAKMPNAREIDMSVADAFHVVVKISTHNGPNTEFARQLRRPGTKVITLHWKDNPQHNQGLYIPKPDGSVEYVDKAYWTEERIKSYPFQKFITEHPTTNEKYPHRSVYYDRECLKRNAHNRAENLDINEAGTSSLFFDSIQIAELMKFTRPPVEQGILECDEQLGQPSRWRVVPTGTEHPIVFRSWIPIGSGCRPPVDREYGIGADISQGTGYSNSVLSVVDKKTREKVFEVVTCRLRPEKFAAIAAAVGRFFGGGGGEAELAWEAQGPGQAFKDALWELGYRRVRTKNGSQWNPKWNLEPGISASGGGKFNILSAYRDALFGSWFANYSAQGLEECLEYVYDDSGNVIHRQEKDSEDPSAARHSHGDIVIADALANLLLPSKELEVLAADEPKQNEEVPWYWSYAGRRNRFRQEQTDRVY